MVVLRVAGSPAGFDRAHFAAPARRLREARRALRSKAMHCGTEPAKLAEYSPQLHHSEMTFVCQVTAQSAATSTAKVFLRSPS